MSEKRGQLDALLDAGLVLARRDDAAARLEAATVPLGDGPGDPERELATGMRVGKYQLVRLLGAGGMGDVWEARDTDLDRRIALKLIRPRAVASTVARARLIREARAMAKLRHPNVISVFDAATLDGRDAIAMELIEGETLASWLRRRHRPDEVLAMVIAAGRGLAAAHAAGLVHRDFKPQNVLVDPVGRAVVTDFGLARARGEATASSAGEPEPVDRTARTDRTADPLKTLGALDSPLTVTGAVLGTPAYMAPEQLSGEPADERADQFSFAVTLWQAMSGTLPFPGDSITTIAAAVATGEPRGAESIPRRVRGALRRALALDPASRWPSMGALLDAIGRAWRRPRRIAVAVGVLAVATLGTVAYRAMTNDRAAPWRPQIVELPAFEENSDGPALSPDGTLIAYVSDREQTGTFRLYVTPLWSGEARPLTPPGVTVQTPRWMRDGKAVLVLRWDPAGKEYRIVRQALDGGPLVDLGPGVGVDDCGDALAIAETGATAARLVLRLADGTRTPVTSSSEEHIFSPRCDPSGQQIVFMRGPAPVHDPVDDLVITDRSGRERQLTHGHATGGGVFTPDGRSIVFSALAAGKVYLYEIATTGGLSRRLTSENGPHLNPDVSSDGRMVAFDRDLGGTVVVAGGGGPPRKLTARREILLSITATRDGASLVASRLVEGGNEIVVIATSDGNERLLTRGMNPFLSADEHRVLFRAVDAPPRLLSIPIEGGPIATVAMLPGDMIAGVDGPDGAHVEIRRSGTTEAWRIGRDGRVESEGVAGLVIPAPSGGWRAIRTFDAGVQLRFVAPGAPLSESAHEVTSESQQPRWLDDRHLAYIARGAIRAIDAQTGEERELGPGPAWGEHTAMAGDGIHWYELQLVGHVTRHLLVNFADRPRL